MLLGEGLEGGLEADRVERRGSQLRDQPAELHDLLVDLLDRGLAALLERVASLPERR